MYELLIKIEQVTLPANGQLERYNKTITEMIICCIGERKERWDDFVRIEVGAISATVNISMAFTSNMMINLLLTTCIL